MNITQAQIQHANDNLRKCADETIGSLPLSDAEKAAVQQFIHGRINSGAVLNDMIKVEAKKNPKNNP